MTKKLEKKFLVAVYGSLRKEMGNHDKLRKEGTQYMGTFQSVPEWKMISINNAYPALKRGGVTSITMEVYSVTEKTLGGINRLEGYSETSDRNHYDRIEYVTPWGPAYLYIYPTDRQTIFEVSDNIVESGDWVEYKSYQTILHST